MEFKRKLEHIIVKNGIYFITTHTYNFKPIFVNKDLADSFIDCLRKIQKKLSVPIFAYALLPHHLHLMFQTTDKHDLSNILFRLKGFSSREINKIRGAEGIPLWQDRYQDHLIRDDNDFARHLDYTHYNPLKHRLVSKPEDWRWSSYRHYLKKGYYEKGWGYAELEDLKKLDYEMKNPD